MDFNILSFLFGALFGSGSVWKLLKYRMERIKHETEKAESSSKLRARLLDLMFLLKEKRDNYADVRDKKIEVKGIAKNILNGLEHEIDLIYEDAVATEKQLSIIENRDPRVIRKNHGGRPAPPTNLRIIDN